MQEMTYAEREHLKHSLGTLDGEHAHVITMIAHWHRQRKRVPFSRYAAHWSAAQGKPKMQDVWPLCEPRRIKDNHSDWN